MFSVGGADNVLHSCLMSRQRDSRWLLKKEEQCFRAKTTTFKKVLMLRCSK